MRSGPRSPWDESGPDLITSSLHLKLDQGPTIHAAFCAAQSVLTRSGPWRRAMSALPPKADMCSATRDVRFVPEADITSPNRTQAVSVMVLHYVNIRSWWTK